MDGITDGMSERDYSAHSGLSRGAIQKRKGALVDRARAEALVFRLARQKSDTLVALPRRAAASMVAKVAAEEERQSGNSNPQ